MSYHIEVPRSGFKELPDRILVREDGAYGASKEHGEPIVDYWYVPEQDAPQAALGSRTCHKVRVHMQIEDEMHCSECGRFLGFAGDVGAPPYNFCPNCGRKVVDE